MSDSQAIDQKVAEIVDKFYFGSTSVPGGANEKAPFSEEHAIRLASKFVVSILTAWWSLTEFFEYLRKRQEFKQFERLTSSMTSPPKD